MPFIMRKLLFFILFLHSFVVLKAAETMLLNFETSTVPSTVSSWLNYTAAGNQAATWGAPNPKTDALNSTSGCYKIVKSANDPYWSGLEVTFATPVTITTANQYLHVYVYKSTASRIALTYTPTAGSQSSDAWQSYANTGVWIDYVLTIPTGTVLNRIAIKIADDPGTYYFDQIKLSDVGTSATYAGVTVNPTQKNQVLDGWGGSLCWWANIMGGYSDSKVKSICDWITDPVNGLNMNIFRFNIGGGDDPTHNHMRTDGGNMPGYKASSTAAYDWTQDANQRKILQQLIASRIAKAGVNDIKLVAFSNSPPYWMTRSGCSAGSTEGNVTNLKSDMFDDFADYLTEVTKYYHDQLGITFDYIEPFNEPDGGWWKALGNQEGCYFSTNDQLVMIRELYAKLSAKNMLSYCKITANDANNMDNGLSALNSYKSAGDILPKIGLASVHSYGGSNRAGLAAWSTTNNIPVWQSESGPMGISGTDESVLLQMCERITADVNAMKCKAWVDWQLAGDGSVIWGLIVGTYSDQFNPVTRAISYYLRAQYSRYLKPGYTIIGNSSGSNVITAISPDEKQLVIVLNNKETFTQNYTFNLSAFSNFGRAQQIRTRALESLSVKNSLTLFNITGSSFDYSALPESVTTFVVPVNQSPAAIEETNSETNEITVSGNILKTNFRNTDNVDVRIYNMPGQIVKTLDKVAANTTIGLQLNSGVYIVKVVSDGKLYVKKIRIY